MRQEANTTIWILRHGESQWNAEGRLQGQQDSLLTRKGLQEAHLLGERLCRGGVSFRAVFSSDLRRARDTAAIVADVLEVPLYVDRFLRERSAGPLEGLRWHEVATAIGRAPPQLGEGILHLGDAPGVESMADLRARAVRGVKRTAHAFRGEDVVVIGHGSWMAALVEALGGPSADSLWIGNGALLRVECIGDRLRLLDLERAAESGAP